jgi:hypothetical protein
MESREMKSLCAMAALVCAGATGAAFADQTILSFGFTDLNGQFSTVDSHFKALGVNIAPLASQGDVSRLNLPSPGSATYLPGQAAGRVTVDLLVTGILANTANGAGFVEIFDVDGDTLRADINGQFLSNGLAVFFNGSLTNVAWTDNGPLDGTFNGPGGGSIPLSFSPAPPPYLGAIVQLYIGDVNNFFVNNFSGISTQVSGVVVPAPSALALLGLGGLIAGRRRR